MTLAKLKRFITNILNYYDCERSIMSINLIVTTIKFVAAAIQIYYISLIQLLRLVKTIIDIVNSRHFIDY